MAYEMSAKGLTEQKPRMVGALAPVTDQITRGEIRLGITYVEYVKQYKGPGDSMSIDQNLCDPNPD